MKLSSSFFSCFCILSSEQIFQMNYLDKDVLEKLLKFSVEAIKADSYVSSQACRCYLSTNH